MTPGAEADRAQDTGGSARSDLRGRSQMMRIDRLTGERREGRRPRRGFSLLEMLVVVIIMGLLVALVAPRILDNVGKSKVQTTKAQIELLSSGVSRFYLDMGRYPTDQEGLEALIARPTADDAEQWDGPYLEKDTLPEDGWGRPFEYEPGDDGRFVVRSLGADGRPGGEGENADLDNRT